MKYWFPGLTDSEYLSSSPHSKDRHSLKFSGGQRILHTALYIFNSRNALTGYSSILHSTATTSDQESLAIHNSLPVATAQSEFLPGQGQDKAGHPARALGTSTENSNHRTQVVKENIGLKREVQRKSSVFGKAGGAESFRDKRTALCSSTCPHL